MVLAWQHPDFPAADDKYLCCADAGGYENHLIAPLGHWVWYVQHMHMPFFFTAFVPAPLSCVEPG